MTAPARDDAAHRAARDTATALAAALLPLAVYLRTMAPTVYGLDSAELATGAAVLGVAHTPGSPLFLLLGHIFTWLPLGDVGYRVNLLSACSGAAASAGVYAVTRRLTGQRLLALATAWYLAFTYYYWIAAVAAELYALHVAIVVLLLWLALRWRDGLSARRLCAFALLFGIGLGNHMTLALLAPGFAWLLGSGRSRAWRQPTWWLAAAACGIAGAAIYLYLPLRADAPMNYARDFGIDVRTWRGFWSAIAGGMFTGRLFAVPPSALPDELLRYAFRLWSNFLGVGCVLGIVGVVADFPARRALHVGLLLMFAAHLAFILSYAVPDKDVMLLPTFLIWSLWAALGMRTVAEALVTADGRHAATAAGSAMLAMAAVALAVNFSRADVSDDWSARHRGEAVFAALAPDAVFIGGWYDVPVLEYLSVVEGQRRDVERVNLFFVPQQERRPLLLRYLEGGRPVYTSWPAALAGPGIAFTHEEGCDCDRASLAAAGAVDFPFDRAIGTR